jgi:anti-sigma factor RsiW
MNCLELDQFLYPYLDGEFDTAENANVEQHLAGCAACQKVVEEEVALREKLRAAARHSAKAAPENLRRSLELGFAREGKRQAVVGWGRAGALAAMVTLVAGGLYSFREDHSRRMLEEAAVRHARGLPFEIANPSPEGAEAWFGGKLMHRVTVPRFPNAVLTGARLSNVTDKEAAYISYETPGPSEARRRMGLFVFQDGEQRVRAPSLPAVQVSNAHGYNVALWRQGEIVYELVTDLDESDIRRMLGEHKSVREAPARTVSAPTQSLPQVEIIPASFQQ